MINKSTVSSRILIKLLIAIFSSFSVVEYPGMTAKSQELSGHSIETVSFNPPIPEDNGAPPGNREGAGSHGLCKMTNGEKDITPLIAIMPEVTVKTATKDKIYIWGETTSAYPTFWFYVDYPIDSQVEFILQDESENEVYKTNFSLDKTSGLISLILPKNKVNLEIGQSYHWYLYIMCNVQNSPDDFVEGWVKRVELDSNINDQLELAQPLERISIYAENGLWFDTLSIIESLREKEIKDNIISAVWTDLLQQIGLEKITQESVVKRYDLTN